mmetsp:Transcript_29740/g.58183  ORF Transcript_29740/g.58183 Transcript_29740/m.58183 type:complete len:132 (-) Transcript_29740:142-537(-)|eukprot:CAMPEP_0173379904 /NCGR_PEP_ID=MMETSP1356-20130122/2705_1 /TAXON_ID=77927 ORGANISM="Hemiselmis virescens, Strain PCC157" /NCGR_SAMPLE_ID=MMETSP1356 /ASSEMBLY_ACC=CAM_ASM_000847 /LENGTH=131 /DNA_ID=CAMNT_0014333341 /DNA_START=27 /DNA_END=422 /DNA_ORIENTATION=+
MASYGALPERVPAHRKPARLALPMLAGALALTAGALIVTSFGAPAGRAVSLEEFALVPVQQLALGDDAAKKLPVERHWETDGWPTMVKCPGAWCTVEPYRNPAYPNNKEAFTGDKDFPLAWGPCNIALQDC